MAVTTETSATSLDPCECCGEPVTVDCCEDPIPATLFLTIASDCACLDRVVTLTHSFGATWQGVVPQADNVCGTTPAGGFEFALTCQGGPGLWRLSVCTTCAGTGGCTHQFNIDITDGECSPLALDFGSRTVTLCGVGNTCANTTFMVTE